MILGLSSFLISNVDCLLDSIRSPSRVFTNEQRLNILAAISCIQEQPPSEENILVTSNATETAQWMFINAVTAKMARNWFARRSRNTQAQQPPQLLLNTKILTASIQNLSYVHLSLLECHRKLQKYIAPHVGVGPAFSALGE